MKERRLRGFLTFQFPTVDNFEQSIIFEVSREQKKKLEDHEKKVNNILLKKYNKESGQEIKPLQENDKDTVQRQQCLNC